MGRALQDKDKRLSNIKMTNKDLREAGISFVKPKNSKYPVEKRLEAVTLYMACGNMRQVEAVTGISYSNLRLWQQQDWWKEMEVEIKAARRTQVSTKLNKLIDKAINLVEDRVDNGDWHFNRKTSEFERVPLSALTANKIVTDMMTRTEAIEKLQQQETVIQNEASIQDTLKLLADQFASMNKKRTVKPVEEVEDAVYAEREARVPIGNAHDHFSQGEVDAIHEKWEAGLQEGSGSLYLEAGSSEEEDGAEQSSFDDDESGEGEEGGWEGRGSQDSTV